MVNVDDAVIARLRKGNIVFEVLVDCENALKIKNNQTADMSDVLATEKIFSDSKKGMFASEKDMQKIFSTNNPVEVAKQIIKNGDIQLTADHRAKIIEEKRKRILAYIQKNGIDPRSNLPHPLTRIELAFKEAKIRIDEYQQEQKQIQGILKKLRPILPIKFAKNEVAIKVAPQYSGKVSSSIRNFGQLKNEDWQTDGSWIGIMVIPAGMQNELIDKLNNMTHGNVEVKILKVIGE